jgi:allophanate hydrolase
MTRALLIRRAGPGVTVQDMGRPGRLAQGLSRGGAADTLALAEGAALLAQDVRLAAIEIAGSFLEAEATAPLRIALTGAPMRAVAGEAALAWYATHLLPQGTRLALSGSPGGYSYLHIGGGIAMPPVLGAVSAHLAAGLGRMLRAGDSLPLGPDGGGPTGMTLPPLARFGGGVLRLVTGPQTHLFAPPARARFCATPFTKDARGNRMGQRLIPAGEGFAAEAGLTILSQPVVPGDVQVPGDGMPYVLLSECQTTGGYPRIGTVIPADLPHLVQAPPGAVLRFRFIPLDEAVTVERAEARRRAALRADVRPLRRDPRRMPDLLSYQLISGVTRGDDLEAATP